MNDSSPPPSPTDIVVIDNVSKIYRIYAHPSDRLKQSFVRGRKHYFREHIALQPLSLRIPRGTTVGIVGTNGSGKSTLLQIITGTLTPTTGSVRVQGRISALLELGAGFNADYSGHDNIWLSGSLMGMTKDEISDRYEEIISFSGLSRDAIAQAVSSYSSGMYVRLAFSVAMASQPDLLIVDEALAVGDEGFQRKCFARIKQLQERGTTILFVSHSARTITDLCDYALLLDAGELLQEGSPRDVIASYHHMLFAREEERPHIRATIKNQPIEQPAASPVPPPVPVQPISNIIPESRISYPEDGGRIDEIKLTDEAGTPVTHLIHGESYRLHYRFVALQPLMKLGCSMLIKTITGIELTGALTFGDEQMRTPMAEGCEVHVSFTIPCQLMPGDYFLNVGAIEDCFGQYRFLHRIVDAVQIKVIEAPHERSRHLKPTGYVSMGISCHLSIKPTP
ncbi:MAG: ABC transporter ATP-binding protein [Alphaproteobacteria bacterium]|nr:MAG: ABC transporter ATP-binding protein [Alphaproteobacteria bacterium]TAF15425.1 MAG: ABC transporter ATP-binding protein [Alphaproteobacteria bacterium]TAF75683.1 MAG: ABC transporter ATP-binding protein [Alphaproteobacteria bacterium]